jgi:hypothetical protein
VNEKQVLKIEHKSIRDTTYMRERKRKRAKKRIKGKKRERKIKKNKNKKNKKKKQRPRRSFTPLKAISKRSNDCLLMFFVDIPRTVPVRVEDANEEYT